MARPFIREPDLINKFEKGENKKLNVYPVENVVVKME